MPLRQPGKLRGVPVSRRKKDRKAKKRRKVSLACTACGDRAAVRRGDTGTMACITCVRLSLERFRSAAYEWARVRGGAV